MSGVWSQLDKEVEDTPMPEEYKEFYVYVLCKDCHKVGLLVCLVCLSQCLSVCLSVFLSTRSFFYVYVLCKDCHKVGLSVHLSCLILSVCLSVCLAVLLSLFIKIHG